MPIYGFECESCGHQFDRLQKLSDTDPTVCPNCGAEALRRQLTAPSFRLSGSGWYETDFKKDGDKKRNLTEKGDGSASVSTSNSGSSDAVSNGKSGQSSGPDSASGSKADKTSTGSDASAAKPAKLDPKPAPKPASE